MKVLKFVRNLIKNEEKNRKGEFTQKLFCLY